MYPTLYHLVLDLLGQKWEVLKIINTFGLLVMFAFTGAAICLSLELKRMEGRGWIPVVKRLKPAQQPAAWAEYALSLLMGFLVSFKAGGLVFGTVNLVGGTDAQDYLFSSQGHAVSGAAGGALALALHGLQARRRASAEVQTKPADRSVRPAEHTRGITAAAAVGGLLGAKLFHWLEAPSNLKDLFDLGGGLTIYGGLIVGALAVLRYCRKHSLPFFRVADATAPGLLLAYGTGRLGCQLAGDGDWGIASTDVVPAVLAWLPDWVWAFDYPNNVLRAGVPLQEGGFPGYGTHLVPSVFPTPIYESVAALIAFAVLWTLRTRFVQPLMMLGTYLMLNGFQRFWVEKIRVNATYNWGFIQPTQAEILSVLLLLGGATLVFGRRWLPALGAVAASQKPSQSQS